MIKNIFIIVGLTICLNLFAEIDTVIVRDYEFNPSILYVKEGDTIRFIWESGTHPVESDNADWATFTISNSNLKNDLKLNQQGTYGYHCTFHGSVGSGMFGTIYVSKSLSTNNFNSEKSEWFFYPNPFTNEINIDFPKDYKNTYTIKISDILGNIVYTSQVKEKIIPYIPNGIYYIIISNQNGKMIEMKKIRKE